jgi:hypothetical protein
MLLDLFKVGVTSFPPNRLTVQYPSIGEKGGERKKGGESFTEMIFSFLERFSLHAEIQYIFYWVTFSPKRRESLYF